MVAEFLGSGKKSPDPAEVAFDYQLEFLKLEIQSSINRFERSKSLRPRRIGP
jgi:hypothetical protein